MPSRHAELVSASIVEISRLTRKWTLKRVQGDVARFAAFALTLFATASVANAQPINAPVDYAKDANWLCRPGRADVCARQPVVTALLPSGYGKQVPRPSIANPAVDCFFVYPTISHDQAMNSDLTVDDREEVYAVQSQFARFAGVCRPFAPIYRQMTMAAVAAAATGADVRAPAALAYGDVAAAFRRYLANDNQGRPFVLIGHSQGSLMLIELIKHEIEGKPVARQMQLAIVPGFNVLVPTGKRVGGTFSSTPVCGSPTETGCVLSWVSYRDRNVPPPGAMFGFAAQPGMTVACVNPARPGATGWVPMTGVVNARSGLPVPGGPIVWSTTGPPPSTFVQIPGLLSSRCVNDGPRGYLSVRVNADPSDARTDRIGGEVGALGFFLPGWGMHLMDLAGPMDDLVARVAALNPPRSGTALPPARPVPPPA
jgi:hypothetical protein